MAGTRCARLFFKKLLQSNSCNPLANKSNGLARQHGVRTVHHRNQPIPCRTCGTIRWSNIGQWNWHDHFPFHTTDVSFCRSFSQSLISLGTTSNWMNAKWFPNQETNLSRCSWLIKPMFNEQAFYFLKVALFGLLKVYWGGWLDGIGRVGSRGDKDSLGMPYS